MAVVASNTFNLRNQGVSTEESVEALRWFVNEMSAVGQRIEAHHFLTTGTCVTPIPVEPGQSVQVDFGWLGQMTVHFD